MIYILMKIDGFFVNKGIFNSKFSLEENMLEVTKEQYDSVKLPCKYVDGDFVECETPILTEEKIEATDLEQLQADVDLIKIEMGLF